jgi:hypothetical protein
MVTHRLGTRVAPDIGGHIIASFRNTMDSFQPLVLSVRRYWLVA